MLFLRLLFLLEILRLVLFLSYKYSTDTVNHYNTIIIPPLHDHDQICGSVQNSVLISIIIK